MEHNNGPFNIIDVIVNQNQHQMHTQVHSLVYWPPQLFGARYHPYMRTWALGGQNLIVSVNSVCILIEKTSMLLLGH